MKLTPSLREQLKAPLGILIQDKDTSKENILAHIPKNSYIITVGDATTEKLLKYGIVPMLQIVDGLEKRTKREPPQSSAKKLYCDNPPAQISENCVNTIKNAFTHGGSVQILVNGEEDLLVIPVCIFAPDNSVVLYGQPHEGLVVVPITREIRNKTQSFLDSMKGV
ncbi:MAG: GTP-dependent dephospho-CoA kinase family protein [Candidatus Nitrosotenuis sp.]